MAKISNGEFVVNAKSTQQYMPVLKAINEGKGDSLLTSNAKLEQVLTKLEAKMDEPLKSYVLQGDVYSSVQAQQQINNKRKL
jgi:hypothetical protein